MNRWSVFRPSRLSPAAGVILLGCLAAQSGNAQLYTVKPPRGSARTTTAYPSAAPPANKTLVSVELITTSSNAGLASQQWGEIFAELGVNVRIRQATSRDKVEVSETHAGPLRKVNVVGQLDRQGRLVLPDRVFTRSDSAKLGEYLRELQTFGRQGRPDGKPLWGLSKAQFGDVYRALSEKVTAEVKGLPLKEAVTKLSLAEQYPVRYSTDAEKWLRTTKPDQQPVRQSVTEFAKGTALAMVLNDYDLGFHPLRTPDGTLELLVEPLAETAKFWPVGWEPKESLPRTAPGLYQMVPVELNDVALIDVLNAVSIKTKVPVRYDHHLIEKYEIDLDTIRVDYPSRNTSWSILLRGVTNAHKLARELKIDENGQPFVWITTLKIGKFGR